MTSNSRKHCDTIFLSTKGRCDIAGRKKKDEEFIQTDIPQKVEIQKIIENGAEHRRTEEFYLYRKQLKAKQKEVPLIVSRAHLPKTAGAPTCSSCKRPKYAEKSNPSK